jgi:hypothetical protein
MVAPLINTDKLYPLALWAALIAAAFRCTGLNPYAEGGGTETVIGMVVNDDGSTAAQTMVELLPSDFNPVTPGSPGYGTTVMTNDSGAYIFKNVPEGAYTLQAVQRNKNTRALKTGIMVTKDSVSTLVDTLHATGAVTVELPGTFDPAGGYVYVPGTSIAVSNVNNNSPVTLDSVPPGMLPAIIYGVKNDTGPRAVRYRVQVAAGDTAMVRNIAWRYARRHYLNTTASGAQVNGDVEHFPVLIRLTKNNFNFAEARAHGEDIRFRKSDDAPMPYEIERWDSVIELAEVWVSVDTVYGNSAEHFFLMYWGNSDATDSANGAAVFDTAAGFAGVWHLGQPAGLIVPDATANGNSGTATAATTVAGAVGMAQEFDGTSSFIQASGPAGDKLNFPENGTFSVSAWVRTNVLDSVFHGIVYKSNVQYGLQMRPKNKWEFCTYIDKTRWEMSRSPAEDNSWHALAGVRNGSKQYLYVDGVCADSSIAVLQTNIARDYDQPLEIGHCPDGGEDPDRYFNGIIDEVRVSNIAYSADWIKLNYMNQKEQNALVVFK